MLSTNLHWRCTETVLRKHATNRGTFVDQHHRQIFAASFFDTCLGDANAQTLDWVELVGSGVGKVNRHSEWINSTDHGRT